jgi:uncharacterized membrane-anchored protein
MNKALLFFGAAVVVQLAILAAVPAQKIHTRITGTTVILKTEPVDPYSVMSGYYVTLSYNISRLPDNMSGSLDYHRPCYVVLEPDPEDKFGAWKAVSTHKEYPATVQPGQVVIKGRYDGWRIKYGIEDYYIPEGMRQEIEEALRKNNREARVEVKVASTGEAALVRLLIGDRTYEY